MNEMVNLICVLPHFFKLGEKTITNITLIMVKV